MKELFFDATVGCWEASLFEVNLDLRQKRKE